MNKRIFFSTFLSVFYLVLFAQPSADYYLDADGKSGDELKTALYNIIKDHTALTYAKLWTAFRTTDVTEDGYVWDMYSDCTFTFGSDQCGSYSKVCDCYNREHSFPKSWFNDGYPMYTDLFHLYPTDGRVNGARGNDPFGEVSSSATTWGTGKSGSARSGLGYSGTVFEPADEYKGDFARTYFYMATRYMNVFSTWSSPMLSGNGYASWALEMLLKWHRNDPVSDKELNRNNAVEEYQDNRNPFIDYPELAEYIWGELVGEIWKLDDDGGGDGGTGCREVEIEYIIAENPVRNEIIVQSNEPALEYGIYTLSGQLLMKGNIGGTGSIWVHNLSNGLYLMHLKAGAGMAVEKIVINR